MLTPEGTVADGPGETIFVVKQRHDLHARPLDRDPARDHARLDHPDRARPRLRGAREDADPLRPLPRRRGVHVRHRRRGDAGAVGRRPRDRRRRRHARAAEGVPRHGARRRATAGRSGASSCRARRRAPREHGDAAHQRSPRRGSTSATRSSCSRCCARGTSRSGRPGRGSRRCSRTPSARRTARRSRPAPRGCTSACALAGVGPGDEVITSPYSFVASANCAIYEGATPVFADIDPRTLQPRPGRGRGGDHAADEGDRRGRHLRLPVRARRAARDLRAARARARRGRVRGARRALQGPPARLARPSRGLRLLPEQADDDGRGRRGHDRLGRGARAARLAPQPGPARDVELAPARPSRLQLPARRHLGGARHRPAREARPHPGRRAREVAARYGELLAGSTSSCRSPTTPTTSARGSSTSSSCRAASTATA